MLLITNNAKNYPVLRRWPTSDKTYTLPAQWSNGSDDTKHWNSGFQITILWNKSNLRAGHNSYHWH